MSDNVRNSYVIFLQLNLQDTIIKLRYKKINMFYK